MVVEKTQAALGQRAAGIKNTQPNYTGKTSGKFNRDRLPDPFYYYLDADIQVKGKGSWRDAICPFHGDTRPSLRVNVGTGAFRCMACGAHGCDVLAFHMQRHGMGFIAAAKALGAWEGQP